jgi:hypothetical protein
MSDKDMLERALAVLATVDKKLKVAKSGVADEHLDAAWSDVAGLEIMIGNHLRNADFPEARLRRSRLLGCCLLFRSSVYIFDPRLVVICTFSGGGEMNAHTVNTRIRPEVLTTVYQLSDIVTSRDAHVSRLVTGLLGACKFWCIFHV